ncbi:MAG TPA: redoxin domain-containing protein [Vicinamibacterales bacterium]|nr:redoxin domain-containing protein [Vicinamibacterales bacterium]HOQ59752.1 redoxin domain-containing protein [Vicinamibacterales bacterium]HPK71777.1 redoxin domain-containing protein [Vicinamibacterales bacterium]
MRTRLVAAAVALAATAAPVGAIAAPVGAPAPAFKGTDTKGVTRSLSDFAGKWVVLEWHNSGCPYVRKHYGGHNMQALQREWTSRGVVWLTVISSAAGQQGHMEPAQADAYFADQKASQTAVLLDPSGEIGRLYDAKTTPHMFVINPDGVLVYNGAIDDRPTTDLADLSGATNYVSAALTEGMAGKAVTVATSRPYGCGVKYAR